MMKSEVEVRKMLERYERLLARNEMQWFEGKVSDEYYLRRNDKLTEVISVLKMILGEK